MAEQEEHPDAPKQLEGWDRTFAQMWELYFGPELEKRREGGRLPEEFNLFIAQVLQSPEGTHRVLLNDEVHGRGVMRASRDVVRGEPLTIDDLGEIEAYELPDELLDYGHFTIVRAGAGWRMFFNFLSGRAKAIVAVLLKRFSDASNFSFLLRRRQGGAA